MPDFQAPGVSHTYGGGLTETAIHPFFLIVLLIVVALIFVLRREQIIVPFLIGIFLIPLTQQIYAVGVHWLVSRIIILATLGRVLIPVRGTKRRLLAGGYNSVDRALIWCIILQAGAFIVLYMNAAALINQFGFLIDFLAAYVVVRAMIQDEADIYRVLRCLAVVIMIVAIGMIREQTALQNVFGMLAGTAAVPSIREGKIRSQGVFQHALTAGTFGATLVPLYIMLWKNGRSKVLALAGLLGCSVITICSNSSTPLLAWVAGLFGICLWPLRKQMRSLRNVSVIMIIVLQLGMKAPFWFLIARVDLTGGSSGYHRAELVDQFIRHFSDWWLIGTNNAANWGWDLWDQQNQFVNVGETGGVLALLLLIIAIKRIYSRIGTARQSFEGTEKEWQVWFLGAAMFSNLVSFFGVNYFDQVKVLWLLLLATIIAATSSRERTPVAVPAQTSAEWWGQVG
jgi:hypothetical protein